MCLGGVCEASIYRGRKLEGVDMLKHANGIFFPLFSPFLQSVQTLAVTQVNCMPNNCQNQHGNRLNQPPTENGPIWPHPEFGRLGLGPILPRFGPGPGLFSPCRPSSFFWHLARDCLVDCPTTSWAVNQSGIGPTFGVISPPFI